MAEIGLFRFLIPEEYGGSDEGPEALLEAIDAFVLGGHDLGLCLSWLDHLIIHTHVIARFGTPGQQRRYLPGLALGDRIGALSASEPETGANPSMMKTTAAKENGSYRIQGQKIFITNGPVADLVIVLARTGPTPGKEGISAFLVDTSTPGFSVKEQMDFGFLQTSPHGVLVFDGCLVPAENLLGSLGDGHVRISRAVFGWERFLLLVALAAHFRALLDIITEQVPRPPDVVPGEFRREIALAHVSLGTLRELAGQLACEVLGRTSLDQRLHERLLFLSNAFTQWWDLFERIHQRVQAEIEFPLTILIKDARLLHINRRLYDLQMDRVALRVLEMP
jgi:hypothetical protein